MLNSICKIFIEICISRISRLMGNFKINNMMRFILGIRAHLCMRFCAFRLPLSLSGEAYIKALEIGVKENSENCGDETGKLLVCIRTYVGLYSKYMYTNYKTFFIFS